MKKLLLLIAIVAIGYSCKKESIEPLQQKINTTQTNCGPLGGCWAGTYVCDSTFSANYVINNPSTVDTVISGLNVTLIADRDSIFGNGNTMVHYVLDSATNQLPYLSASTILNYNSVWLHKNDPWSSWIGFETKTGKSLVLNKLP